MQNLFAFLRRFRVFIFFSALQFLCLVLYVQFVSFPKSVYLSTASTFNGKIQSVEGKLTNHFDLEENNTALRLENANVFLQIFIALIALKYRLMTRPINNLLVIFQRK
jgi:rod shape-determining protein MreC